MIVYHGNDKKTAKIIKQTGILKGDFPLFGVGVCLSYNTARSFSGRKVQKYLNNGREYARKNIAVIKFEIESCLLIGATKESNHDAFTLNINGKPLKELKIKPISI